MMSSMKKPKDFFIEENYLKSQEIPSNFEIQAKNSIHLFEINFQISQKDLYDETLRPIEFFDNSVDKVLAINLRLKNKNQNYYNKNNEKVDVKEYYQDIYTIEELKNNSEGFEWFTELIEFKNAFISCIKKNNFELLIIKNILILNLNVRNYFGDFNKCILPIRPYFNKLPPDNFWNIPCKYDQIKEESYTKNKSLPKKTEKDTLNTITIPKTSLFTNKKRLRNNKDYSQDISTINISISNSNIENEKSQNDLNENIEGDLPKFESDALAMESKIITDLNEEEFIGNAITVSKKKYRLLYRASRDGDSANRFHYICDKHSNLIVLIKTQKGLRFGGFTSSKFRSTSHLKFDNNAFLFSLDNKKVFNIIPGQYAIYCYDNTGPCFSKGSLYVPNSFFSKYGKTRIAGGPFQFRKDYELNNGNEKFLIKELEVFQVKVEENTF